MSLELANLYIKLGKPNGELDYDELLDWAVEYIEQLQSKVAELEGILDEAENYGLYDKKCPLCTDEEPCGYHNIIHTLNGDCQQVVQENTTLKERLEELKMLSRYL